MNETISKTGISKQRLFRILFRKNFNVISNLIAKTVISKKLLGTWSISVLYSDVYEVKVTVYEVKVTLYDAKK